MAQGGTARINIAPNTPLRVAEGALQNLQQRGVGRMEVSAPFALYQGKPFYTGAPARPPQIIPDIGRLHTSLDALSVQKDPNIINMLAYSIYIGETGEILGVQRIAGPESPEIYQELMHSQVMSPAMVSAEPVPFVHSFRMGL
jgi:hypothetical protein